MLIVCPTCATSYRVQATAIGAAGREVRCARCRTLWFAAGEIEAEGAWPEHGAVRAAAVASSWAESPPTAADDPALESPVPEGRSPPLVPAMEEAEPTNGVGVGEDIDSYAARRGRRYALLRGRSWQPSLAVVILTLFAINAALVGWRVDIVRMLPQTASLFAAIGLPVNLRGLSFENVTSTRELQDGVTVLVVEGSIVNIAAGPVEVPRLRLAVRNASGGEIYTWTALPDRPLLAPGETLPFRTRLASPPADGRDVQVRFFHRHDIASTGR